MSNIIDTHCHYNLEPLFSGQLSVDFPIKTTAPQALNNWQAHWQKAKQHGVITSINIGSSISSSQKAIQLAEEEASFFCSVAVHPLKYVSLIKSYLKNKQDINLINNDIDQHLFQLEQWLETNNPKIIAVGETGFDYFNLSDKGDKRKWIIEAQEKAFIKHLQLAKKFNLPTIIHVRDKPNQDQAYIDTLRILKDTNQALVLHCISGPLPYVKQALDLGAFIGVAGNVSYENAVQIRKIVEFCPQNRLLLETDAPYLAPLEHKGEVCEPWLISKTANFLQTKFKIDLEQILTNTYQAFAKLWLH